MSFQHVTGKDPRSAALGPDLEAATRSAVPSVAIAPNASEGLIVVGGMVGVLALGAVAFLSMAHHRHQPTVGKAGAASPAPPRAPATVRPSAQALAAAPLSTTVAAPAPAAPASLLQPGVQASAGPILLVDLGIAPAVQAAASPGGAAATAGQPAPPSAGLTADELFAGRVGASSPERSRSRRLALPQATITEGTIIPAVLETAVNTDLSGYVRALVSRDVRSFDGSAVLIPRGARLTGQYRSGLASGQTRVYIQWSRVMRPDGVSIQLNSPGIDANGQSGATGVVDEHARSRFGPTILLSILGGAISSLSSSSSVTISTAQSTQDVASAAFQSGAKIGPTITVPQGAPIQVFVTRDLEFEGAAGASAAP